MKIARFIRPEEMHGMLVPGLLGATNTQSVSFAEGFGKSITSAEEKEVLSGGKCLIPAKTSETEVGKNAWSENPFATQAGKDNISSGTMHIVSEMAKDISANAERVVEGIPSKEEGTGSESSEGISTEITKRIVSGLEDPVASTQKQGAVLEGQDETSAEKELTTSEGKTSDMTTEVLNSLQAGVSGSSKEEAGSRTEEGKDGAKVRRENTPHKLVEKGNNKHSIAKEQEEGIHTITVTPTLEAIVVATVSREKMPQQSAIGIAETVTQGKNSSIAPVVAPSRAGRTNLGKMQIAGAAESSSASAKEDGTITKRSTPVDPAPKESGPELHEAKPAAAQRAIADGGPAHQAESVHTALMEASGGVVSAVTQVQHHLSIISSTEKVAPSTAHMVSTQSGAESKAPNFYTADEHKTLSASSTTLEVGLPNGTHGWLKVRAELADDGGVHASVTSNSSEGTEMLRRELPSLTNYLHQEQVPVSSVVIHMPSGDMDLSNFSGGTGQNHEAGRGSAEGNPSHQSPAATSRNDEGARRGVSEEDGGAGWPSFGYAGAGGWLSVRA